ncbi:MAG: beta-ketoacyl-ACP synthase II [Anaerolineae bacterium]
MRVVITGMGAVTALGLNVADFWHGALEGRSGVDFITHFNTEGYPAKIAAMVNGFDPLNYMDRREAKRMDRFTQFAFAATQEAMEEAGLDMNKEDPNRVGLEIGSAVGGLGLIEEQAQTLQVKGPRAVQPTFVPMVIINMAPCHIAIIKGMKGPANAPVGACATGAIAIGEAMRRLKHGDADVIIAGGSEAVTTPLAVAAFGRLGALSPRSEDPKRACRPFDAERDGTVVGEGAAVLVLETLEHALKRDAPILAELAGYGLTADAYHVAAPDPTGSGAARAISLALKESCLSPEEIGYICAHGTGTPLNDVSETKAIKTALRESAYRVPISSNKPIVGHTLGAAGAVSAVMAVKAINEGVIPPTINLENPDPECELDYVPCQARYARVDAALVNAFGFGGQNACLVIKRFER